MDDSQDEAGGVEIEMSAQREDPRTRPDALVAQREVRARVFGALRAEAARDRELLALLDAYESGHHIEADAEAKVGVVGQAFKNLRRRFKTIRGHLSDELRGAAIEVMVRDGGAPAMVAAHHCGRQRADAPSDDSVVAGRSEAHVDASDEVERSATAA